jgi:hypothetical protein
MSGKWRGILVILAEFLFGVFVGTMVPPSPVGTLAIALAGACLVAAAVWPRAEEEGR